MRAESGGSTEPFLALGNCRTNFFNIFTFILTLGILLLCVQGGELTGEAVKGMCAEKRAFYRIVSGLHTSITVHLSLQEISTPGTIPLLQDSLVFSLTCLFIDYNCTLTRLN